MLMARPVRARKPRMMNFSVYWNYQSKIAEVAINQVSEEDPHRPLPHHLKLNLSLRDHSPAPAAPPREPTPPPLDINSATRVRALYTFSSNEVGELNFERGDMIKVLDRGFQEWWRGACNGKIGVSGAGGKDVE
jgi:hypothetical protein